MKGDRRIYRRAAIDAHKAACRAALDKIFRGNGARLTYRTAPIYYSYIINLELLVLYALEHKIEPVAYIESLREIVRSR